MWCSLEEIKHRDSSDRITRMKNAKPVALKEGWFVAVVVKPGTAPRRCYVGEVQATDARGFRITTMDWVTGRAASWDLFVPHKNVDSILIATEDHDLEGFLETARRWPEAYERKSAESGPSRLPS